MSQKKRLSSSSGGGGGGGGGISPSMITATKKAKNQQQTTLVEQFERNGKTGMVVDESSADVMFMDGVEDPFASTGSYPTGPASAVSLSNSLLGGTTANLSRKKATPLQPTKKLVIKPFKDKPKLPNNFEEVTWAKIKEAVSAIHLKQPVSCSLEELHRVCGFFWFGGGGVVCLSSIDSIFQTATFLCD